MRHRFSAFVIFCLIVFNLISCKQKKIKVERAFYYWKSDEQFFNEGENKALASLNIKKLYVKFFEVEADPVFKSKPFAKTRLQLYYPNSQFYENDSLLTNTLKNLEIIPTIFIRNNVFNSISENDLDKLADNIFFLINKYTINLTKNSNGIPVSTVNEIQIDCDWTERTKDKYFYLLKAIKKISEKKISCTLRLYPYAYPEKMGIPPVDKATLMCYNLTNPLESEKTNSIQNNSELELYLKEARKYPLHLDIALPVFSWILVYKNDQFSGVFDTNTDTLKKYLKQIKPFWYEAQSDIELDNVYLQKGDKLKIEETTKENTNQTIGLLKKYVKIDPVTTVSLFHLNEDLLSKYSHETIDNYYASFAKQ